MKFFDTRDLMKYYNIPTMVIFYALSFIGLSYSIIASIQYNIRNKAFIIFVVTLLVILIISLFFVIKYIKKMRRVIADGDIEIYEADVTRVIKYFYKTAHCKVFFSDIECDLFKRPRGVYINIFDINDAFVGNTFYVFHIPGNKKLLAAVPTSKYCLSRDLISHIKQR